MALPLHRVSATYLAGSFGLDSWALFYFRPSSCADGTGARPDWSQHRIRGGKCYEGCATVRKALARI